MYSPEYAKFNRSNSIEMQFYMTGIQDPQSPFFLYVHPEERNISYSKVVQQHYTRSRWKIEFHADELERHSFTGKTGAFYTPSTGLTNFNRRDSENFKNFMLLFNYYKNNALTWKTDVDTNADFIENVGRIVLCYDECEYYGRFETFSITETAETPFIFSYNFDMYISTIFRYPQSVRHSKV